MTGEKIDLKVKDTIVKQAYGLLGEYEAKGYGPKKSSRSLVEWIEKQEDIERVSVYKDMDITVEFKDKTRVGILLNRDKIYGGMGDIRKIRKTPISMRHKRPCLRIGDTPNSKKAGVLDPLYDDWPPQSTPDDICDLLDDAGYDVEFVSGDDVNLNFFSGLDEKQYGVVFIRTHGGMINVDGDDKLHIMARPFFDDYPPDSGFDGVNVFMVNTNWGLKYAYAFNNEFVLNYMNTNSFPDSLFHLLVCHGGDPLAEDDMVNTFMSLGVGCYTGWTANASSTYGDPAAVQFFDVLCDTSSTFPNDVEDAIDEIASVGRSPDPNTGAVLMAFGKENMQLRKSLLCLELKLDEKQLEIMKKVPDEMIEMRVALPEGVRVFRDPDGRPDGGMVLPATRDGRRIFISDKSMRSKILM